MSKDKRILCVGMCVLDIIHVCKEFPQEDTDKRCENGYWQRGGNASNNCTVLQKLGAKCEFLGMTSNSPAFQFLYEDCVQRNILIDNCPKTDMDPPFSSVILVNSKGSRTIVHSNPGFPILTYDHFKNLNLSHYKWIHFEGRNVEETVKMMEMIRKHNEISDTIMISVELEKQNKNLFTLAMRANVVFIAKDMAEHMGWHSGLETVMMARNLITEMQLKSFKDTNSIFAVPFIISPWGSVGCDCLTSVDEHFTIPAVTVEEVVDSLGAGDTFVAGFLYAMNYLNMNSAKSAVSYANQVAAFKIKHRGFDALEHFVYN